MSLGSGPGSAGAVGAGFAVVPFVVWVLVGRLRHDRGEIAFRKLVLEPLPNPGLLVGVLDLVAGAVLDRLGVTGELRQRMQRQVAAGACAEIEVLVEPAVGWGEEAPLVPRH